jgi:putative endonuclease
MPWFIYILRCSDGSFYTGYINNLEKRLESHNAGNGAKYTRSRRPCEVVYTELFETKGAAMKREYRVKKWTRAQKQALIDGIIP